MKIFNLSALKTKNGLPYFEIPEMADIPWLRHAFLTRKGGASPPPFDSLNLSINPGDLEEHVSKNGQWVAASFGLGGNRLILLHQIHRDRILILRQPLDPLSSNLEYDAVITDSPDRFPGIKTADCLPILIVDRVKKVVGAIHAGREGTALHITRKVLNRMEMEWGCSPRDLLIALGPCIGRCCYEIDAKVFLKEWSPFSTSLGNGKWRVDLPAINIAQIKEAGIQEDQIFRIDLCTCCLPDLFFSYRGEGQTGRQISFIGIT
jgi:polyphenol oxidase